MLAHLKVKLYADGADKNSMLEWNRNPLIQGFTTNPTLMRKSGVRDYEAFARGILDIVREKPVSFEVLSDDFNDMRWQARKIGAWQSNVFVKIPVMNSRRETSLPLVRELAAEGVQVNVTAVMTTAQVRAVAGALNPRVPAVVSVFAGRIADTGVDPAPVMRESRELLAGLPRTELLWASVREVLNLFQADSCGCSIVTVPHEILRKALDMVGMDLDELSLATVRLFARDAQEAGLSLDEQPVPAGAHAAGANR